MTSVDSDRETDKASNFDAEEVLARLSHDMTFDDLGAPSETIDLSEIGEDLKRFQEHELVKAALSQGVDLRQYAREIEVSLRDVEKNSIQDYVREADNLAQLHNKIQTCDTILERMETMLSSFQSDLGAISSEIRTLQDESLSMNIKLRNRRSLNQKLSHFVSEISVSPDLIHNVSDAEVNTAYLDYVTTLNSRLTFASSGEAANAVAKADIDPVLENLKAKAVGRLREFLLSRIGQLRKSKISVEVVQQTVFLKHKYFYVFLRDHAFVVAREVRENYVDTLSKVHFSGLRAYFTNLLRLLDDVANKDDMVGASEDASKSFFSSKHLTRGRNFSAFLLADRDEILKNVTENAIVFHTALQAQRKLLLEQILRSVVLILMNTACFEYQFLLDFFGDRQMFPLVFTRSLTFIIETTGLYVANSFDCIGLMLIAQMMQELQQEMINRRMSCLDTFFEKMHVIVWTRFRKVLEMNLISVRTFAQREEGKLKDASPHYVTRRFADLSSSLLLLHQREKQHTGSDTSVEADSVVTTMYSLRTEVETLLDALASRSWATEKRMISIFLINNLDLIQAVYADRGMQNAEYLQGLESTKTKHVTAFVDDQLVMNFGSLVVFVKTTEAKLSGSTFEENRAQIDEIKLAAVVDEFARSWASGIDKVNSNVMRYFPNFKNGVEILKQVLGQLVMYYTRFLEIIKRCYKTPPFARSMVDVDVIMEEIKKYSRAF